MVYGPPLAITPPDSLASKQTFEMVLLNVFDPFVPGDDTSSLGPLESLEAMIFSAPQVIPPSQSSPVLD